MTPQRAEFPHLRPEEELLLCCGRAAIEPSVAARCEHILDAGVDWPYVMTAALGQHLAPQVYSHLTTRFHRRVPEPVLHQMRAYTDAIERDNLQLSRELLTLADRFTAARIAAIPFKGPEMAAAIYGTVALRRFHDLDILVQPRDVPAAARLLELEGYVEADEEDAIVPLAAHNRVFRNRVTGTLVELHWTVLAPWYAVPFAFSAFWERARPVSLLGRTVRTLSPEDLLMVLSVHSAKHEWSLAYQIADIAEIVVTSRNLDWTYLTATAQALGCARMVRIGLCAAAGLFETRLPEEATRFIAVDPAAARIARVVGERLFGPAPRQHGLLYEEAFLPDVSLHGLYQYLAMRERVRDRIRCAARYVRLALFTPTERDRTLLPLPTRWSLLYAVFRPVRLVFSYSYRKSEAATAGRSIRRLGRSLGIHGGT
jgi:hypothetical protein